MSGFSHSSWLLSRSLVATKQIAANGFHAVRHTSIFWTISDHNKLRNFHSVWLCICISKKHCICNKNKFTLFLILCNMYMTCNKNKHTYIGSTEYCSAYCLEWLHKLVFNQGTALETINDENFHQLKILAFVQLHKANIAGCIPVWVNGKCMKGTDRMK